MVVAQVILGSGLVEQGEIRLDKRMIGSSVLEMYRPEP